ncbi:Ldh family oxidoreductase [Pelagibacteraceae bacterium]|nr:Ldh family oxidoreductase [Pelagibacteraceae bacterium]
MIKIKYSRLLNFIKKILIIEKFDEFTAKSVAYGLCNTSLRGVDSHGVRLLPHYLKSAVSKRKNKKPKYKIKKKYSSLISVDADNAFGHASSLYSVNAAMKIANKNGICAVSVYNSSHCGSLAATCLQVAKKNFICLGFTTADALMLTHNSKETFFGTNPFCVAAPRVEKDPFCFDSSTSTISWNKLMEFRNKNMKLDGKYAANNKGRPTDDPFIATSLLPFAGYKGFGLASVVEMFTSVYSGSILSKDILPMFTSPINKKRKISHFYIIIKIDGKQSNMNFKNKLQEMTDRIRKQKPLSKKNKVFLPNDPEIINSKKRLKDGIPITDELYEFFLEKSKKHNIKI